MSTRKIILAGLATLTAAFAAAPADAHLVRSASSFTPTGMEFPNGVAVEQATGAFYVAGYVSGNVEKFSASGALESAFVSPTFASNVWGVAVDNSGGASKGDVYVAEAEAGRVAKLDSTGGEVAGFTPITASSIPPGDPGSAAFEPAGVAVDPATGNVVVGDTGKEVDIFSSSGAFISQFEGGGGRGVAVGKGSVIFTSGGEGAQEWSPSEEHPYSTPKTIDPGDAYGVAVDLSSGDILADDTSQIAEYEASGAPLLQFGSGLLSFSPGVAVDEKTDTVYATNLSGGQVYIFGPPVAVAGVSTGTPATDVVSTSASVSGSVNPEGTQVTGCRFEYGPTEAYGVTGACSQAPPLTGNSSIPETAGLVGLQPNTTYHYRLVAVGANGPSYGEDETLETPPAPPSLVGQSVSALTQTAATLNATVNPNNQASAYHFEFGPSTAYGTTLPASGGEVGSQYENVVVGQQLSGLTPGTTYHFRVVTSNAAGSATGTDETFTTPPPQSPVVSTGQPGAVTQSSATLSGTLDTLGFETTYEFDLGTDTSYGTQIFGDAGAEPGSQTFTVSLQGLAAGTTYHYRVVASNIFGTSYGADQTFTTASVPAAALGAPPTQPLIATPTVTYPTEVQTTTTTAKKPAKKKRTRPNKKTAKKGRHKHKIRPGKGSDAHGANRGRGQ